MAFDLFRYARHGDAAFLVPVDVHPHSIRRCEFDHGQPLQNADMGGGDSDCRCRTQCVQERSQASKDPRQIRRRAGPPREDDDREISGSSAPSRHFSHIRPRSAIAREGVVNIAASMNVRPRDLPHLSYPLPTTAFRLAGIAPSMRCGLMRPHLRRWRRSRITLPSTGTVLTRSANRRQRPGFGGSRRSTRHKATRASRAPATTHAVERGDELFGVKSSAVVDIDRARPNIKA
jgi:hypothetical protein